MAEKVITCTTTPEDFYGPMVRETFMYKILGALQVLDVATTWFILHNWGERAEGNPVVAWIIGTFGLSGAMLLLLGFKLAVVYSLFAKQTGVKLISAVYSLVIINNLLFLFLWFSS